jgi:hypothetical protein
MMGVCKNPWVNRQHSSSYSILITSPNSISISEVVPVAAPTFNE